MRIAIVDADLITRKRHRFPNLACMKISGYHKEIGDQVTLITDYIYKFDKIYLSKVFTDTQISEGIINLPNVEYGNYLTMKWK